jgi:hypothetical protein
MSSSVAPRFPKTSVFIPAYWENARGELLTQDEADARYLKFPVGQGTESIPNLIVSGTTTLGTTSATTLSLTSTSTSALTIGNATSATGNMNLGSAEISRKTTTAGTNQALTIYSQNTAGNTPKSQLTLYSGNNVSNPSLELKSEMLTESSALSINNDALDLYTLQQYDEEDYRAGILTYKDGDGLPLSVLYALYNVYVPLSSKYVGVRCKYNPPSSQGIIEMFSGATTDASPDIASFSNTAISLYSGGANNTVANFTSSVITFFKNLTFNSNTGYLEKSNFETATTSGNYTMTSANSFLTTINTPTANRNFILPAPAGQTTGTTYGICNKSTSFTIAVQSPSGTTIFTIPVATNATNGGSFAKFAIALSGGTNTYFRCG